MINGMKIAASLESMNLNQIHQRLFEPVRINPDSRTAQPLRQAQREACVHANVA